MDEESILSTLLHHLPNPLSSLLSTIFTYSPDIQNLSLSSLLNPTTLFPILITLVTIYATLVSIYHTTRLAVRVIWFVVKWGMVLLVLGSILKGGEKVGETLGWRNANVGRGAGAGGIESSLGMLVQKFVGADWTKSLGDLVDGKSSGNGRAKGRGGRRSKAKGSSAQRAYNLRSSSSTSRQRAAQPATGADPLADLSSILLNFVDQPSNPEGQRQGQGTGSQERGEQVMRTAKWASGILYQNAWKGVEGLAKSWTGSSTPDRRSRTDGRARRADDGEGIGGARVR
jgi:hypothetical protein